MILDGKEFMACEVADPLGIAADVAFQRYLDQDDPAWLAAYTSIVSTKTKINSQCLREANETDLNKRAEVIKRGHPFFSEIQRAIAPVADNSNVQSAFNSLATDTGPLAASGPTWLRPALVAAGLLGVAVAGFFWVRSSVAPRRRRNPYWVTFSGSGISYGPIKRRKPALRYARREARRRGVDTLVQYIHKRRPPETIRRIRPAKR